MTGGVSGTGGVRLGVLLVSAALLGFELALMRHLLYVGWHHFAFLVIAVAVLGFGASGTLLVVLRSRSACGSRERELAQASSLSLACGVAIPLCWWLATMVPVSVWQVSISPWGQAGLWLCY